MHKRYYGIQPLDAKPPDEAAARAGTALSAGCDFFSDPSAAMP